MEQQKIASIVKQLGNSPLLTEANTNSFLNVKDPELTVHQEHLEKQAVHRIQRVPSSVLKAIEQARLEKSLSQVRGPP